MKMIELYGNEYPEKILETRSGRKWLESMIQYKMNNLLELDAFFDGAFYMNEQIDQTKAAEKILDEYTAIYESPLGRAIYGSHKSETGEQES